MPPRTPSLLNKCSPLIAALVLLMSSFSHASNLLVYNNNDSGAGSLRQAISDNNATIGGNTILFSNIVTGTITLTSGHLLITKAVTISGPGANVLAVDGNNASKVFVVTNAFSVSISGLTITRGRATGSSPADNGGGIYNARTTTTISNCVITANSAAGGGGGLYNDSRAFSPGFGQGLTVVGSTISSNSAPMGGGFYNYVLTSGSAQLVVKNCTVMGNSAGDGGGFYNFRLAPPGTAVLTVFSSTLTGNFATNFGDAIYNSSGSVNLGNTILKSGPSRTNLFPTSSLFTSYGYNLSSDNGSGYLTNSTDQPNTDAMLGPLQFNGGPTPTCAPLPGSPAIDKGKKVTIPSLFVPGSDQRGRCRTYDDVSLANSIGGDGTDIGAVEVNPTHTTVVGTTNESGVSLRYCLCDALPGDTITFSNSVTGTITLTNGELPISTSLTIQGPGANLLAVSGNAASRVFRVAPSTVVNLSGLTITNGYANVSGNDDGGGIFNDHATLTLSNCIVTRNVSGDRGGGIYSDGSSSGSATLSVVGSIIAANASYYGGGIFNNTSSSGSGMVTVVASTIRSNTAVGSGGGLFNQGAAFGNAPLAVIASTLHGNSAMYGGGIYNDGVNSGNAMLTLTNCTLSTNTVSTNGGGIYNNGNTGTATCALWACTLSGNSASNSGGGVFSDGTSGSATVTFANTILQAGASGANFANNNGSVGSAGYNLSSDNPGSWFTTGTLGNQVNTDAKLGPLRDNGGPTLTHALMSNSPAIDKGKSFGLITDQRGAARPFDSPSAANASGGDGSDIGAFELGAPTLNIQRFAADAVLSWPAHYGDFTLQSVTNVAASNSWTNVAGTPAVTGNRYVFTNGPITGNLFYRLRGN